MATGGRRRWRTALRPRGPGG
uniref:Uncharacterized protein n=1 Tax=Arundo donax TaxID=35708 RepID=A0A0A8Z374_ARUDO